MTKILDILPVSGFMICLFEDYTLNPSSSLYLNLALKNKCKGLLIKLQGSVIEVKGQNFHWILVNHGILKIKIKNC